MELIGNVKDVHGETLIGVNVVQKGTSNGTVTDLDGNFIIRVPADATLVFSYIGYEKQEKIWDGKSRMNITLKEDVTMLDDVVVIGAYGTVQKRTDMVGSAFQVNSDRIETLQVGRVDNLLEGIVPGLQVMPNSDDASSTKQRMNLRVRGKGSMSASNEPLWIVDGTRIFSGDRTNMVPGMSTSISPLSYLSADDIESITILKDATETSIYGADGANGVILVTTKGGAVGKTKVGLSLQTGIAQINQSAKFKVLNGSDYLMLAKESYLNSGRSMETFPFQDNDLNSYSSTDTDWSGIFYDTGYQTNAFLSLSGGKEGVSYYLSGGYFNSQSTVIGNTQERYSIRGNLEIEMSQKMDFSLIYAASYNTNDIFIPGNDYYKFLPIYTPYNPDGTFRLFNKSLAGLDPNGNPVWQTSRFLNSVAEREENDNRQKAAVSNVNALLEYDIVEGLTSTTQFGIDYQGLNEDRYSARTNWSGMSTTEGGIGYANRNNSTFMTWTAIERLNYNRTFGRHRVGGLLGFEASSKDIRTMGASGSGFINDKIKEVSYAVDRNGSSSRSTSRSLSYFLQGTYSYDQRYYFTVNARRDGNSGFGSDSQWGNFASAGASWNIHNEDFFQSDLVNVLKVKVSYGSNGNSRIGSQEALGLYSYGESHNYMGELGGSMSGSPNKKLSWETAYITNFGVRIKMFDRADLELEAYNKRTVNLLSNLDVSRTTGDTRSYRNSGEIINQGIEATLNVELLNNRDANWWAELNASHNRNKLIELYNGIEKVMGNYIWREGYDLNTYYIIRWAGVDPRDGAPLWYDSEGNLTRTYNDQNRVPWKSSSPLLTGGISSKFTYKNYSVRALLTYVLGGYAFSTFGRNVMSDGLNIMSENQSVNQLDRWQKPGDVALSPKPIWGTSTRSVMSSTRHIYKTTHMKFKNVALSYALPEKVVKPLGIASCNLHLIADNLFVWTPYDKKDRNSYKQSMSGYPIETSFSLGVDLSF
ncbi:SusC/RagA family TonB-linked outer membrane protein [Petrimonas mucosa]|uniref:SusC/RagA family TonB-linked outer membrane protein n=1 Tax=Petrimonas mucosa TaxID=1642646 RepID=UPI001770C0A8|nr:SusC/RagA family TonB-linked outer membrane protein [Petrimonas mucosa]HHT29793.1 SusC/RagA family TonB-linked outer membrane protein [Petrimonas mucosa]